MQGFHPQAHGKKKPMQNYANGGPVKGPGTGTSDDVDAKVRPGSYVMPADTMDATKGFNPEMRKVALSNGESVLTPEQMQAIGAGVLEMVKSMTHENVGQEGADGPESTEHEFMEGEQGEAMEGGEGKQEGMKYSFADGGLVDDEKRPSSFGDAAAAGPGVTQVATGVKPSAQAPVGSDQGYESRVNQIPKDGSGPVGGYPGPAAQQDSELVGNIKNTVMALGPVSGAVAPILGGIARAGAGFTRAAAASPLVEKTLAYGAPVAGFGALASASGESQPIPQQAVSKAATAPAQQTPVNSAAAQPPGTAAPAAGFTPGSGNVNVNRQANGVLEFSGQNVAGDVSYGGPAGFKPSGAGVSAQNMAAADQLAARSAQERSAVGDRVTFSQPNTPAPQGFSPPDTGGYGLLDKNYQRERELRMATTSTKSNLEGQKAYDSRIQGATNALTGFQAERAAEPRNSANQALRGREIDIRGQEVAQRGRDGQAELGFQAGRLANETARTKIEGQKAGFEIGQAQRMEGLRAKYEAATDPKVRAELAQQLRTLSGGKDQDNRFTVVPGGQEFDQGAGVMRNVPARVLNNQTGQFVETGGGKGGPLAQNQAAMAIVNDTSLSKDERKAKLREMGYN